MSVWLQIKKTDIELDHDELNIDLDSDEQGNNYATVKVKDLEEVLGLISPAKLIVDLYECRAQMIRPMKIGELQHPHELLQYNWLNAIIAQLSDKYKVKFDAIKEEMRTRSRDKMAEELEERIRENKEKY